MKTHNLLVRLCIIITMLLMTVLEIGPVPITALLGLYVALFRPLWFINLMDTLYDR